MVGCFSCIGGSSKSSKKKRNDDSDTETPPDSTKVEQVNEVNKGKAPMGEEASDEKNKQTVDKASASNEADENDILNEDQRHVNQARMFTYEQLVKATENFSSRYILGQGGFGIVYRGRFEDSGQIVAIKQLNPNGEQGVREFVMEVKTLNMVDHPNLVKLVGYCAEGKHRLLVYEFMALGSLEDHLHGYRATRKGLDWNTRINIAAGAARGLEYLHDKMKPAVIYRDMKASNILLSEGYHAKLSDFGLARVGPVGVKTHVTTQVMGTYGYCAPEYAMTGKLSYKSDIYSFGVLLLELITGRKAHYKTTPESDQYLVAWAKPLFKDKDKFGEMADPALKGEYPERGLYRAVSIAAMCVQEQPDKRPSIADVVTALNYLASKPYNPSTNPGQGSSSAGGQGSSSAGGQGSSSAGGQGSGDGDGKKPEV